MKTQVKKIRERAGLTQKQLAEKLGTTQQSVYFSTLVFAIFASV